jgi:hypothetical protein
MDWRTKCPNGHFSDKVEDIKAIIVPRPNRHTTSREFAVFCDNLYRNSDRKVDIFCAVLKKYRITKQQVLRFELYKV